MSSYNINLYWVRHGYSCANVVRDTIGTTDLSRLTLFPRSKYAPDAQLADYGIKQVENAREQNKDILKELKVVLTSELRRAIETALVLFKDRDDIKIYPVPYINEDRNELLELFNLDSDNETMGIEKVTTYLEEQYPTEFKKIDFSILNALKGGRTETFSADIEKFFNIVIPHFIKEKPEFFHDDDTTNICVVSHHKFIEKHLKKVAKDDLPYINNAEIYIESITVTLRDDKVEKQQKEIDKCKSFNNFTCKVSKNKDEPIELDNNSFKRCDQSLQDRLKNIGKYTLEGTKRQKLETEAAETEVAETEPIETDSPETKTTTNQNNPIVTGGHINWYKMYMERKNMYLYIKQRG